MREYVPTDTGNTIATDSGLAGLAQRLIDKPYDTSLPIIDTLTRPSYGRWEADDQDNQLLAHARTQLRSDQELEAFDIASNLDVEQARWRRHADWEAGTLFPVRQSLPYAAATEEDPFIISGAAGLGLLPFRAQCALLSRRRFREFGFRNFTESCAFAGAYVVSKLVAAEANGFDRQNPSFTSSSYGIRQTTYVGGTLHGDFVMAQSSSVRSDIFNPAARPVEYGPKTTQQVLGYHSIEPDILAALISSEYLRGSTAAARDLINEFASELGSLATPDGNISTTTGNFADYGDGDARLAVRKLAMMVRRPDYTLAKAQPLLSAPYAPQSNMALEILSTETGVTFQNRDRETDKTAATIQLDRSDFTAFFNALIRQTSAGLGRTSPAQLLTVMGAARAICRAG